MIEFKLTALWGYASDDNNENRKQHDWFITLTQCFEWDSQDEMQL